MSLTNRKITVIEAAPGEGKTTFILQKMKKTAGPWLYITPYLSEVERVEEACKKVRPFNRPSADRYDTKSDNLRKLVSEGRNICSTHELFKRIDAETVEALRLNGYKLVMDEIIEVIVPLNIIKERANTLFTKGVLKVADPSPDDIPGIKKLIPGDDRELADGWAVKGRDQSYSAKAIQSWAASNRLVQVHESMLLWLFPAETFSAFKEIYCLTYLFEGSFVKAHYDLHGVEYEYKSVERGRGGKYNMVPYKGDADFRESIKPLLNVYQGKLNEIGDPNNALSSTWWKRNAKLKANVMKKRLVTFFRNHVGPKPKAKQAMWTCLKADKARLTDSRYGSGWLPVNQRATNKHAHRKNLAFVVNRYIHPSILMHFKLCGIDLPQNLYAVSELIQWLWRSQLRTGNPVNLFLPSARMRGLLNDWLKGSLEATIEVESI